MEPLAKNFKVGTGRLTTDRFDFQDHVSGVNNNHKASQIVLSPVITIDSVDKDNVQDTLNTLSTLIQEPLPEASTSVKGIIKLSGDIAGTADSVSVVKLRSKSISTLAPSNNNVLTFNSVSNAWEPKPTQSLFTAAGDLSGSNTTQNVVSLTGSSGVVNVLASSILFSNTNTPTFGQAISISGNGRTFVIEAQNTTGIVGSPNKNGGTLVLSSGAPSGSGHAGSVKLMLSGQTVTMAEVAQLTTTQQRVLSLFYNGALSSTQVPANAGSYVAYVANTPTPPTTDSPSGGALLYALDGKIRVKQEDGSDFAIGDSPNPNIEGDLTSSSGQLTTIRVSSSSTASTRTNAYTLALDDETHANVEVVAMAKIPGAGDVAQYNMKSGYVRTGGGSPSIVGSITYTDTRTTGAGSGFTTPDMTISGNNLIIRTGYSSLVSLRWFFFIRLIKQKTP